MFARGSPRATFLSRLSLSLSLVLEPLNRTFLSFLTLLFSILETGGLTVDWFGVREPKSLLMGSFGFDHRLTFPIHPVVRLPRSSAFYLVFADLLVLVPTSFQSLLYRVVTERSSHPPS